MLTAEAKPTGLPLVLTLWTREHLDDGDLDDDLASQLGRISNRLVRIIEGPARTSAGCTSTAGATGPRTSTSGSSPAPRDFASIQGSYAVEWDDILPPGPEDVWRADLHAVATKLANWGGHARA